MDDQVQIADFERATVDSPYTEEIINRAYADLSFHGWLLKAWGVFSGSLQSLIGPALWEEVYYGQLLTQATHRDCVECGDFHHEKHEESLIWRTFDGSVVLIRRLSENGLHIGVRSADGYRLWVDGELVAVPRKYGCDQFNSFTWGGQRCIWMQIDGPEDHPLQRPEDMVYFHINGLLVFDLPTRRWYDIQPRNDEEWSSTLRLEVKGTEGNDWLVYASDKDTIPSRIIDPSKLTPLPPVSTRIEDQPPPLVEPPPPGPARDSWLSQSGGPRHPFAALLRLLLSHEAWSSRFVGAIQHRRFCVQLFGQFQRDDFIVAGFKASEEQPLSLVYEDRLCVAYSSSYRRIAYFWSRHRCNVSSSSSPYWGTDIWVRGPWLWIDTQPVSLPPLPTGQVYGPVGEWLDEHRFALRIFNLAPARSFWERLLHKPQTAQQQVSLCVHDTATGQTQIQ